MNILNSRFVISAVKKSQYPTNNFPEIVLVGKSNIGKSTFINSIVNRNGLAKTSSTPGKTRLINFYEINNSFHFVDLPGYGFSKMSKVMEETSSTYINEYLSSSKNIKLVVFLVDIRHSPTKLDIVMFNYLAHSNLNFIIVANKSDKIAKTKVNDYINVIKKEFKLKEYGLENSVNVLPFSSITKQGKDEVMNIIENCIN